jgi:hypothetical protein
MASREDVAEGEVQVAMLRCAIWPKYSKIFSKFNLTVTQQKDLDLVLKAYRTYFEPKKLIKSYVTRFQQRHQGPHESLSDYIASVRELASHCEFGALEESQVAIQISNGVHDIKLKEKLWDDDLSLEQIIQKCNTFEQCMETRKLRGSESQVNYNTRGRSRGRFRRGRGTSRGRGHSENDVKDDHRGQQSVQSSGARDRGRSRGRGYQNTSNRRDQWQPKCNKCGMVHEYRRCPAYNRYCNVCNRLGHFAKCCREKRSVNYNDFSNDQFYYESLADNGSYQDDAGLNEQMDTLNINVAKQFNRQADENDAMWIVNLKTVHNDAIIFQIDTGAQCSLLTKKTFEQLGRKPSIKQSSIRLRGVGGTKNSLGCVTLDVVHKGQLKSINCELIDDNNIPNILCDRDSVQLNLIRRVYKCEKDISKESAKVIYDMYADVTKGIGKIPGQYALKCNPNAKPVAHPPRPIPAALREPAKKKLDEMESLGIIAKIPVGVPTPWCSSLHIVVKKNVNPETDVRVTIDPRDLNSEPSITERVSPPKHT